ncbi:hypothetical protein V6N12_011838 [Hibiscus sabdariffa]|uniref:Large ribosomal subunit protein mL45 n=1 Tax=Hibiscus sabdariffa TaxID=183260 RepID=A0ABR2CGD3_9ROSI
MAIDSSREGLVSHDTIINDTVNHDADSHEAQSSKDSVDSDLVLSRRSTRNRQVPKHLQDYVVNLPAVRKSPHTIAQADVDVGFALVTFHFLSSFLLCLMALVGKDGDESMLLYLLTISKAAGLLIFLNDKKSLSTQATAQVRKVGAQISIASPGFVYEPYAPREPIPFWKSLFNLVPPPDHQYSFFLSCLLILCVSGISQEQTRTKKDIKSELKSAYAIAKLRKSGYSKNKFYKGAVELYREISTLIANGDKKSLRKAVTEIMFSALKNEIKQRESIWSNLYWELVEPVVKIRTLRARMIGVDKNDLNKVFIQLTLEFLTKEKFEAYDSKGDVVAGDKNKEMLTLKHMIQKVLTLNSSFLG